MGMGKMKDLLKKVFSLEYEDLIKQFEKKLNIVQYGLIDYISTMNETQLDNSILYYEERLKMLFDIEIREELFEYVKVKLNGT